MEAIILQGVKDLDKVFLRDLALVFYSSHDI